jgi:hypothetical protein
MKPIGNDWVEKRRFSGQVLELKETGLAQASSSLSFSIQEQTLGDQKQVVLSTPNAVDSATSAQSFACVLAFFTEGFGKLFPTEHVIWNRELRRNRVLP